MQLQDIINWLLNLAGLGYVGVFLISLIGALAIFFPIPYTVVIFALGKQLEPVWIALAAGTGAAIGEFSGYLIGYGGRKVISERYKRKMDFLVRVFNRFGPITIFAFALTPLPDDLIFIPLGVMRYSMLRTFIPAFLGKVCMNLIVAYAGRFSIGFLGGLFGVESDWVSIVIGFVIAVVLFAVVLVAMFKIDWEKRLEKYLTEKEGSGDQTHESDS